VFVPSSGFDNVGYNLYMDGKLLVDHWQYFITPVEQVSVALDTSPHKFVLEHHATTDFDGPFLRMGITRQGT
jgi:hypothetical protein